MDHLVHQARAAARHARDEDRQRIVDPLAVLVAERLAGPARDRSRDGRIKGRWIEPDPTVGVAPHGAGPRLVIATCSVERLRTKVQQHRRGDGAGFRRREHRIDARDGRIEPAIVDLELRHFVGSPGIGRGLGRERGGERTEAATRFLDATRFLERGHQGEQQLMRVRCHRQGALEVHECFIGPAKGSQRIAADHARFGVIGDRQRAPSHRDGAFVALHRAQHARCDAQEGGLARIGAYREFGEFKRAIEAPCHELGTDRPESSLERRGRSVASSIHGTDSSTHAWCIHPVACRDAPGASHLARRDACDHHPLR